MTPANDPSGAFVTDTVTTVSEAVAVGGADPGGPASLEKVREILFGHQMREVDRRFARLEDRLVKEARDLREEVRKRLDAFEQYVRQETEALAAQSRNEQAERAEADARLARDLADNARGFDGRTAALTEQVQRNQRDVRQQLLDQQQRLSDDIRQQVDEVMAALAREAQELRTDKTDRLALASLLKEMAMRLTGEFRLPGDEDRGNG
jgi:hypothetical protein